MKRSKIKPTYLAKITSFSEEKKENDSIFDRIEHLILKILACLGIIFLFLIWNLIPLAILSILGINYQAFSDLQKVIFTMVSDCLFLGILFLIYRKDLICDFRNFFNRNFKDHLKVAIHYWILGLSIMFVSNFIISIVTSGKLSANEETVRQMIQLAPWYMAFELIIFAPLSEELVFRKSLRNAISNRYLYAIISGLIFGGLHVISSLEGLVDLLYFIPYCSLGFIFALLYSKTDNIFSTITIHSIHNTLALILYLMALS